MTADLYRADHLSGLSTRYAAKHDSVLRCWILPVIGERADPLEVCFVRVTSVRPTARARVIGTLAREMFGSGAAGTA